VGLAEPVGAEPAGAELAGAEPAGAETTLEELGVPVPDPPGLPGVVGVPLPGFVLSQAMGVIPVPTVVGPGFLNAMAWTPSGTAQPLPEFARNISGRASKAAVDVSEPVISTVAHFMYISRLPSLLNQVLFSSSVIFLMIAMGGV